MDPVEFCVFECTPDVCVEESVIEFCAGQTDFGCFTLVTVNIEDNDDMSTIVKLPDVYLRSNESKAIYHKLKINCAVTDLTGWTIELFLKNELTKTITEISSAATTGQIKNQTTNKGEYFFTLLETDLQPLVSCGVAVIPAYIRYTTPDTSPPRVFSNVEFTIYLTKA